MYIVLVGVLDLLCGVFDFLVLMVFDSFNRVGVFGGSEFRFCWWKWLFFMRVDNVLDVDG